MSAIALLIAFAPLASSMGCNFIVDVSKAQCSNDGDCRGRGTAFEGSFCSAQNVCVRSVDYCSTNAECIDRTGNDATICRKSDNTCVSLLNRNCKLLADKDDLRDDNALIFGAHGIPSWAAATQACEFGLELVRRDFKSTQGGLPPTPKTNGKARPIVFLSCDIPIGQQERHKEVSDHLFDVVRVPVTFGPFVSVEITTYGVQKLTNANTAIFTVADDQPAFDIAERKGKFWSFGFPRGAIAAAQTRALVLTEEVIRKKGIITDLKVAYLYSGVGATDNDAKAFSEQVRFNNNKSAAEQPTLYREFAYGSPVDATFNETASNAAVQVKAFAPDIVLYRGADEVTSVAKLIEDQLPGKAYHILPIEGRNGTPALVGNNADLRRRLVGFKPGRYEQDPRVLRLDSRYSAVFGAEAPPSPLMRICVDSAYHALYAAGAVPSETMTGSQIGEALLTRFGEGGVSIDATPSGILKAFSTLNSGQKVFVVGNEQDGIWDPATGVNLDLAVQFWCVDPAPAVGGNPLKDTGVFYNLRTNTFTGTSDLLAACLQ